MRRTTHGATLLLPSQSTLNPLPFLTLLLSNSAICPALQARPLVELAHWCCTLGEDDKLSHVLSDGKEPLTLEVLLQA